MKPPFSIIESLRFGWHKTRAHSAILFKIVLIFIAIMLVQNVVLSAVRNPILSAITAVVIAVVEIILGVGAIVVALKLARGEHAEVRDIVPPPKIVVRAVLASFSAGVLVFLAVVIPFGISIGLFFVYPSAGIPLVIISGFFIALGVLAGGYLTLRYILVRIAAVDLEEKVFDIVRHSARMTRGVKQNLLSFLIVVILLNILGAALLFVGLLVTIPVTILAYAHVYLELKKREETVSSAN